MTPQEKAIELFKKYFSVAESIEWTDKETALKAEKLNDELGSDVLIYWNKLAKESALISVNEIIDCNRNGLGLTKYSKEYWEEVKKEIKKI